MYIVTWGSTDIVMGVKTSLGLGKAWGSTDIGNGSCCILFFSLGFLKSIAVENLVSFD